MPLSFCCDWQGTRGDLIKADDTDKIIEIGTVRVLLAGDKPEAEELVDECSQAIRNLPKSADGTRDNFDLTINQYTSALRSAVRAQEKGTWLPPYRDAAGDRRGKFLATRWRPGAHP
jgi:hypothetical protein